MSHVKRYEVMVESEVSDRDRVEAPLSIVLRRRSDIRHDQDVEYTTHLHNHETGSYTGGEQYRSLVDAVHDFAERCEKEGLRWNDDDMQDVLDLLALERQRIEDSRSR